MDPGSAKHGVAIVNERGETEYSAVVSDAELEDAVRAALSIGPVAVIVGNGTRSQTAAERIHKVAAGVPVTIVNEYGTTQEARQRVVRRQKPGCLGWMVPVGMRAPQGPVDDMVAVILAERWWRQQLEKGENNTLE